MSAKPTLKIDWATHEAAKYACENWHYSGCLPSGKLVKIGVWENSKFIGVVLFSRGAAPNLMKPFGLTQIEGCELTRIALTEHVAPVSRIVSIAFKFLKKQSPGLRVIVSFADPEQGHVGGIYQAGGWLYAGLSSKTGAKEFLINGEWTHPRSVVAKYGSSSSAMADKLGVKTRPVTRKHRYLMPLDEKMARQIEPLRKPYPKRAGSKANVASAFHAEEGGATPTPALQSPEAQP